jgi:hypothetical protein
MNLGAVGEEYSISRFAVRMTKCRAISRVAESLVEMVYPERSRDASEQPRSGRTLCYERLYR